jgi:hypothetical protein
LFFVIVRVSHAYFSELVRIQELRKSAGLREEEERGRGRGAEGEGEREGERHRQRI